MSSEPTEEKIQYIDHMLECLPCGDGFHKNCASAKLYNMKTESGKRFFSKESALKHCACFREKPDEHGVSFE